MHQHQQHVVLRGILTTFVAILSLACAAPAIIAQENPLHISIDRPGDREFVRDSANIIDDETETKIVAQCDQLLTDKATPIIVVTIDSMAKHGPPGQRIETFAMLLFNQWQIGHERLEGQDWNTGILLLVSKGDRRARIELGAGWGHDKDQVCQQIMDTLIVPEFKAGDYSQGILAGVDGLNKMARELALPTPPKPMSHYLIMVVGTGLVIFTIVSLIRRGSGGWAWIMWAAVFGVIGYLLYQMAQNRRSSGGFGGGSFGGGSFGGGFSGGGGASGSW